MKAARWHGRGDIRVDEVAGPGAPARSEVSIRVRWCGICGSDLHEYTHGPVLIPVSKPHAVTGVVAPIVMGHEFSGDIVAVGADVSGFVVGDRVTALGLQHCGACYWCQRGQPQICRRTVAIGLHRSGALAEYINVRADFVHALPPTMSYELGALVEPVAVAVHAVRRASLQIGNTVAVVGAGPIGLALIQAARVAGASRVFAFELAQRRKELALTAGADEVLDPRDDGVVRKLLQMTSGIGADIAFDCAGVPASGPLSLAVTRSGGSAVIVAICDAPSELRLSRIVWGEKQLVGSIGYSDEFPETIRLLADGRIKAELLISSLIGIDEVVVNGFQALVEKKDQVVKVLVSPQA